MRRGELRAGLRDGGREHGKLTGNQHVADKWEYEVIKESCRAVVRVAKV